MMSMLILSQGSMGSNICNSAEAKSYGAAPFNPDHFNRVGGILRRSPSVSALHSREHYESNDVYQYVHHNLLVEEYQLQYNQKELKGLVEHLYWRKQCPQLVPVLFIHSKIEATLCTQSYSIKVYVEHMPLRLTKLNDIPFPQNLYVLRQSLMGFRKAYAYYRELMIHEDQICISKDCKIKIWINPNLASTVPSCPGRSTNKTEGKIVGSIIQLIDRNTDHTLEPVDIVEFLKSKHKKFTFEGVLQSIQQFASILKLQIPQALHSARILFEGCNSCPASTNNQNRWQEPSAGEKLSQFRSHPQIQISPSYYDIPHLQIKIQREEEQLSMVSKDCSTDMMTPHKVISSRSDLQSIHRIVSRSLTPREPILPHIIPEHTYCHTPRDRANTQASLINTLQDSVAQPRDRPLPSVATQTLQEVGPSQKSLPSFSLGKVGQWPYFQGADIRYIDTKIAVDMALLPFKE